MEVPKECFGASLRLWSLRLSTITFLSFSRTGVVREEYGEEEDESLFVANAWQRFNNMYIRPVLTVTEDNQGTDSCASVWTTVKNFAMCRAEAIHFT